jgi:hypothetical protein
MHIMWSFSVQPGSAAQCPTDCASSAQRPVQQSALDPQISPPTRQAPTSAQRPVRHDCPQHSPFPPHISPAGLHIGGGAQSPPMHTSVQQSAAVAHVPPAELHGGPSPHEPVKSPSLGATHASEQHALANVQDDDFPAQPTVGRQTLPAPPLAPHHAEQH